MTNAYAVYAHPGKRKPLIYSAYTTWYNSEWGGYVGTYIGFGETRHETKKDAIAQARQAVATGAAKPKESPHA